MKTFLVTNLSFFGDVLLTGQLCSDIKRNYPDSKIIFLVNKPFLDAAKYIPQVDEALYFDKNGEHKGILGFWKFIKDSKLRGKIDTAITIYGNDRGIFLAWLLGAKTRITGEKGFFMNHFTTHVSMNYNQEHMADANADMLKVLTGKDSYNDEISYEPSDESKEYIADVLKETGYDEYDLVGLCTLSKRVEKDWNPKDTAEFIRLVNESGKRVVMTGTADAKWFVDEVKAQGVDEFLDMTGKTSIVQLGALAQACKAFVSVDTGAMHLAYATKTPTLGLFFVNNLKKWAPKNLERNTLILSPRGINAKEAYDELEKMIAKNYNKVEV